jgi:hypothetical protein
MRDFIRGILAGMAKHIQGSDSEHPHIVSAEKDGSDGVLVRFSDGTITGYVVEELLRLRPIREKDGEPMARNHGQEPAITFRKLPVLVPAKKRM